jgi:hypothetical protein
MDTRGLFDWLVERYFSRSEAERGAVSWLVYRYRQHLEQHLSRCESLVHEHFDLGTAAPYDRFLPLLTASMPMALGDTLRMLGFREIRSDDGKEHVFYLLAEGMTREDKQQAEATAERIVGVAHQLLLLDNVAHATLGAAQDYLYASQPVTPQRAAAQWLTGSFLTEIERRSREVQRPAALLPASVAVEARRVPTKQVTEGQWDHVIIILSRLGYRIKALPEMARAGATPSELAIDTLEALVPPTDERGTRIVFAALRYMRTERARLACELEHEIRASTEPVLSPVVIPQKSPVTSVLAALSAAAGRSVPVGDCDDVRARNAAEAREESEHAFDDMEDMSALVDALVRVIEDAESHETLEDRRSAHIITELNEVRRQMIDMESQASILEAAASEMRSVAEGANADLERARNRIRELEARVIEYERAPRGSPVLPAALPPMSGGPPPPPPPPPGGGPRGRIPGAAGGGGGAAAPSARKPKTPEGPVIDLGEMQRAAEARARRLEQAAVAGTAAGERLARDAAVANNSLTTATRAAAENEKEKAPMVASAQKNPAIAALVRARAVAKKQALPVIPEESEADRLTRETAENLARIMARRRRDIDNTPAVPDTEPWETSLATLFRDIAPYCYVNRA